MSKDANECYKNDEFAFMLDQLVKYKIGNFNYVFF
jgi:hypothetical protein